MRNNWQQVISWIESDDSLLQAPEKSFKALRLLSLRLGLDSFNLQKVRAERLMCGNQKVIPIIDLFTGVVIDLEKLKAKPSNQTVMQKVLYSSQQVWTIPQIQNRNFERIGDVVKNESQNGATLSSQRRGSRTELRRERKAQKQGLNAPAQKLPENLEWIMENIQLTCVDPEIWILVKPTVTEIMRRSHIRGEQSFKTHVRVFAMFVHWAHMAKRDLSLQSLLTTGEIEAWAGTGLTNMRSETRATYRSLVRKVASHANPNLDAPPPIKQFPHRFVKPPYSTPDIEQLFRLATSQSAIRERAQMLTCMALGFGAGLDSTDLLSFEKHHATFVEGEGFRIAIGGPRARVVWMLPQYWNSLHSALNALPGAGSLFTNSELKHKGTVSRLHAKAKQIGSSPIQIDQGRMRNTWLCMLMNMPIPLNDVMVAAGLESARTLGELLPYANQVSETNTHDLKVFMTAPSN